MTTGWCFQARVKLAPPPPTVGACGAPVPSGAGPSGLALGLGGTSGASVCSASCAACARSSSIFVRYSRSFV